MSEDSYSIKCSFTTEDLLYLSYMPFVQGGGLFIRTHEVLPLGAKVNLEVNLLNEPELYKVEAKVVWLTPKGAAGNKPAGIGMQFHGEGSRIFANKIETYLAGMLKSAQITDTM